jgi:hypothetical protein
MRFKRNNDGTYTIQGKSYKAITGTRARVWHGEAYETSGHLKKNELVMNKHGRIVSKDKYNSSKKEQRLLKHGYGSKKGVFGFVRTKSMSKTRKSRK